MKKISTLLFPLLIGIVSINAQNYQWARSMGEKGDDNGNSIAIDDYGNVYTTGLFSGSVDFDPGEGTCNVTGAGWEDIFISKLDAAGNFVWVKSIGGNGYDVGNSIAIDDFGNLYITGHYSEILDFDPGEGTCHLTNAGAIDIFVLKLDQAGNFVWAKSMGGASSERGLSIALDGSGNIYTTGWFSGTADFDPGEGIFSLTNAGASDIFVLKLDPAGNFLWAKSMGGVGYCSGNSIAVDNSGNVYTTGYFDGNTDFDPGAGTSYIASVEWDDAFISKLDAAGNFLWANSIGGPGTCRGNSIVLDNFDNIYTTGYFSGTTDFDPGAETYNVTSEGGEDIFISKLDANGNFLWARIIGGSSYDYSESITLDGSGNILATGSFGGTVDFDPGTGTNNLTSAGRVDIFILKLDEAGNFIWAKSMGGTNSDFGQSITVDGSDNIYTTGSFVDTTDFDPGIEIFNLTSFDREDIFISKLDTVTIGILENSFVNILTGYPNPTNNMINIDMGASYDEVNVIIRNQLGQEVLIKSFSSSRFLQLNIPGEAGMYFIEVSSGDDKGILKVVKE